MDDERCKIQRDWRYYCTDQHGLYNNIEGYAPYTKAAAQLDVVFGARQIRISPAMQQRYVEADQGIMIGC